MRFKQTKIWRLFSSIRLAIWLLSIISILALIGTFIPQNQEEAFYIQKFGQIGYQGLLKTGLNDIYASWWFLLFLILFSLNLAVCLANRFSLKARLLGSMLSHLSILVILLGALVGMRYGEKGFIEITKGQEVNSFITEKERQVNLGFSLRLNEFIYNEYIDPKEKLLVYCLQDQQVCKLHNSSRIGKEQGLLAQIPVEIAVESAIADTGYKIKVLRYLPDFTMDLTTKSAVTRSALPNNPAIELELKDKSGNVKRSWVFARFPDMHKDIDADFKFVYHWAARRPKDFISKVAILKEGKEVISKEIRVNGPLHFGGYTFFQSSYDRESLEWSGLQVVKDPGVPVVYSGFIMLILGLTIIFYVNPLIQQRR